MEASILEALIYQSLTASPKLPAEVSTDLLSTTIDFTLTPYAQGGPHKRYAKVNQ